MNDSISHTLKFKLWTARIQVFKIARPILQLVRVPTQVYGNSLLSIAVLFSSLSSVYLKTVYRENMNLLQTEQTYYESLEEKQHYLQVEHESLTSILRLQKFSQAFNLIRPETQKIQTLLKK